MPTYTISADITDQVAGLDDLEKKSLPFVLAKSLTQVVGEGQKAVRARLSGAFKLRNKWTSQGIRTRPADKKGSGGIISADVHTDTANRATGAPDYMGRQEDGGEKVPYGGRQHIAVPTKYLLQMAPGIIPAELRPKNLLGAVGGRYLVNRRGKAGALRNQKQVRGFVFFLQTIKDGHLAIMGRYFTERNAYPFYLLIDEAFVKKSALEMGVTVQRVVDEKFAAIWEDNWRDVRIKGLRL